MAGPQSTTTSNGGRTQFLHIFPTKCTLTDSPSTHQTHPYRVKVIQGVLLEIVVWFFPTGSLTVKIWLLPSMSRHFSGRVQTCLKPQQGQQKPWAQATCPFVYSEKFGGFIPKASSKGPTLYRPLLIGGPQRPVRPYPLEPREAVCDLWRDNPILSLGVYYLAGIGDKIVNHQSRPLLLWTLHYKKG